MVIYIYIYTHDKFRYNIMTEIMQATTMDNLRRAKGGSEARGVENESSNEVTKSQTTLLR